MEWCESDNSDPLPPLYQKGAPLPQTDKEDPLSRCPGKSKEKAKRTSPDGYVSPGTQRVAFLNKETLKQIETDLSQLQTIIDGVPYLS